MKQRRINATLKRVLPPIAALAPIALLILTSLPQAGTAAPRLERQPLESLTALNSTEATERATPLSAFSVPSVASVLQSPGTTTRVSTALRSSPVMFIENVGQFDPSTGSGQGERARFQVRGGMGTMWLAEDAIWVTVLEKPSSSQPPSPNLGEGGDSLPSPEVGREAGGEGQGVNLKLSFVGANPHAVVEPFDPLETSVNYFIGNDPARWQTDVPVWGRVRYVDLYPGVDLELTGEAGYWVWRLVCGGANCQSALRDVRLRVEGAETVELLPSPDAGEGLLLTTAVGEFTLPLLQAVAADGSPFPRAGKGPEVRANEVTAPFSSAPLLPGPSVFLLPSSSAQTAGASDLLYATFLGESSWNEQSIAVDGSGAAYVTGLTESSDFPTTAGAFDTSFNGYIDAFVAKLNPAGSALAYATFLGGSSWDEGRGIAVDGSGAAYVTGLTESSDFPTTAGAFDTSLDGGDGGGRDAFVAKLNPAGSALAYATFLGGSEYDWGYGIAVDGSGAAYVTGHTHSSDFPATAGAFDTILDGYLGDAFVAKLNSAGSALAYATFLGGSGDDGGRGIAVDGSGAAYVTGYTKSSDFPATAGAFDTSHNGGYDAFVARLNPAGSALAYVTFLGGSRSDRGYGIAVDGDGAAYVTGSTSASDFPTTAGAFDTSFNGYIDAFVAKLNPAGSALAYATFLGGSEYDSGNGIAVDGGGAAYVTGHTYSSDFPTTAGAFDTSYNGRIDAFVAKLNPDGSALAYATFLGGSDGDRGYGIAVDGGGAAYVTGFTDSSDFPTTAGAFDTSYNGDDWDAFVAKLAAGGGPEPTYSISGQVTDAGGNPISDVTISDGAGHTATTDSNGNYTISGLSTDTYTLTPSKSGYTFAPASRTLSVPPSATGQDFTATPTSGENPPTTTAPPPSLTDEMFKGTDPTEGYKYAAQGPIEIDIVIDRYYGPTNNGALDSSYIGKSVAEYSWLTIQAFDVDPDEVDRVFVNGHEVGWLTGFDGDWWPDGFLIHTDWLHFPDLSSGANPPDTTHAHNTIRIEIDEGGQGRATQVAWARFMVPGTRPVLLVHGLDFVGEIFCRLNPLCDLTPIHNGWNAWQDWVNTDNGSKGFLAEYVFPNVQSATENGTQGPRTRELESDVRAYTDGLDSYKDNSDDIIDHIRRVKDRYGVDKVNLVGHSKGGIDVRATLKKLQSMGLEDAVENAIVLGTPNEGLGTWASAWFSTWPILLSPGFRELTREGMLLFNTVGGHGAYDQYFLYTVAGDEPNTPWGKLEQRLNPNDGTIAVSSVHGSLLPFVPPDYTHTSTLPTNHTGLHDEKFVFADTVRPLLQPVAFGGAGAMSYATRQAGPEEEAPVRPTRLGVVGNPVQYLSPIVGTISSGEVQTHTIAIDGDAASVSLMWGYADSMGLTLYDPQGQEIDPSASAAITYTASITDKTVGYVLEDPEAGQWTAQITATNTYTDGEDYLLVTAVRSTITVTAEVDQDWYAVNEPVQISAILRHGSAPVTGAVVTATVFFSGTTAATTDLYDDGLHGDGAADDGWYTNTFTDTSQIGYYLILVSAEGTSGGTAFSRVTSTQAAVASTGASLNDSYAEGLFDTNDDGLYNTLVITTGVSVTDTASYRLVGMVTDTDGNYVADAATEITLTVGVTDIPLQFSGETIAQAGRDGPYQLRSLALLDLSSATPVQADYRAVAYTTGAYTYTQFQRAPIIVSTYATDQGVDTNDNGKHDLLRINASVDVRYAGTYTVTARLLDADWQDVASVYTTTDLVTGTNAISLDFNGAAISASGRNGPYRVSNLVITYGFDPVTYLAQTYFRGKGKNNQ